MKVKLTNNFHNTESTLNVIPTGRAGEYTVSRRVQRRIQHDLCGVNGCICGDTFGARGGRRLDVVGGFEAGDWVVQIAEADDIIVTELEVEEIDMPEAA